LHPDENEFLEEKEEALRRLLGQALIMSAGFVVAVFVV
jgi:hypothetical protein